MKVYYTPNGGYETDITEFVGLQNKRGLQLKDAKCDLNINNSKYRYKTGGESIFQQDGDVTIYADYSPITKSSSQLILSGQIQEITHNVGERGSATKLSVSDKTNLLLGGLVSKTEESKTVDSIVRTVIGLSPGSNDVTTTNVVTTTTTGAAFPSVNMAKTMKPVYEWLTDLSQPGVTGEDKAYLFYVDKDNDLHWFYPSATVSSSLLEGSVEIYNVSMKKSQDELVNMLIYNAGQDLKGNGILWYYYDSTSRSNKLRMKFQPMIDIGRDLIDGEILATNLTESAGGAFHYKGKDYVRNGSVTPVWGGGPYSTDDTYNDAFRTQAKSVADAKSSSYVKAFAGLRWKGNIEVKGTHGYVAGDLLTVDLPTLGILSTNLRVWDVAQSFGADGWITGLELREDDVAIAE